MSLLGSLYSLPPSFFDVELPSTEEELGRLHLGPSDLVESSQKAPGVHQRGESGGQTCQACGIGVTQPAFANAVEQREHFKTDWHRYNVRRRLAKQLPVSEAQFEQMLEDGSEVSSISGSSSEDEDVGEQGSGVSTASRAHQQAVPPQMVFTAKDGTRFCVWKSLLEKDTGRRGIEPASYSQLLTELQQLRASQGIFVVILLRGGHFAASVFKAQALENQPGKQGAKDAFEVLAHKTCHRYVIRAKAGGRQSTKDNSGKTIKSAGAALRRYNEAALDADVSSLMASWSHYLQVADRIFVQTGSADAKSIFSADAAPLSQQASCSGHFQGLSSSDPRVRRIPFATQRPTFSESRRVVGLLVSVFEPSAGLVAAEQAAADAAAASIEQREKRRQERRLQKGELPQRQQQQQQQQQQQDMQDGKQDDEARSELDSKEAQQASLSPLHRAAHAGDAERVSSLLLGGADVTVHDSRGRTPYLVSSTKEVRDAFRRYMASEPDKWDYVAAGIPSALTEDMEAAQAAKKAEKKARQKAKEQERKAAASEKKKKAEEDAKAALDDEIARAVAEAAKLTAKMKQPSSSQAGKVGAATGRKGAAAAAAVPLSPEEIARRREMQAAAAEARMKALQAASESQRLY